MTQSLTQHIHDLQSLAANLKQQIDEAEQNIMEEKIATELARNSLSSEVASELENYEPPDLDLDIPMASLKLDPGDDQILAALRKIFKQV
jgi:phage shock protein A